MDLCSVCVTSSTVSTYTSQQCHATIIEAYTYTRVFQVTTFYSSHCPQPKCPCWTSHVQTGSFLNQQLHTRQHAGTRCRYFTMTIRQFQNFFFTSKLQHVQRNHHQNQGCLQQTTLPVIFTMLTRERLEDLVLSTSRLSDKELVKVNIV